MSSCERSTVIKCAFGSRDPLPPRVASLGVEPSISSIGETDKANPGGEHYTDVKTLGPCSAITSGLQPSASTPASGPKNPRNWSHVVAFGSKEPPAKTTTKRPKVATPYSILLSITKIADILDVLMLNCPDFPTLFALVATCTATKHAFERHSQGIIKAVLEKMPQELQYLTVALIGINGSQINGSRSIRMLMETWLGMGPKPLSKRLQKKPLKVIRKLASSFSAIDRFIEAIPKNCVNNFIDYQTVVASRKGLNHHTVNHWNNQHPLLQQTEWSDVPDDTEYEVPGLPSPEVAPQGISLPLNPRENYRIKRALLRYELFCALFYLAPDRHFDTRHHPHRFNYVPRSSRRHAFRKEQVLFLKQYVNPWEIGELAVVTHFMYDLVRSAYFHKYKSLRYDAAYRSWFGRRGRRRHGQNRHHDHEEVVDEFDNNVVWLASQGLSLLRKIYDDRNAGYRALTQKYCAPRYRLSEYFLPIEECTDRRGYGFVSVPNSSWEPRTTWPDTPGMELPSRGWLGKSPTTDDALDNTAYWGEKWMRKIGYFIWDRD